MNLTKLILCSLPLVLSLPGCQSALKAQAVQEIEPPQKGAPQERGAQTPEVKSPPAPEDEEEKLEQALEKAQTLALALGELVRERRAGAVSEWTERNREMKERIRNLLQKGHRLRGQALEDWERRMDAIDDKQDAVDARLGQLASETGTGWVPLRNALRDAWNELSAAVDDASSAIRAP